MNYLIRGGTLISPRDHLNNLKEDLYIKDGRVRIHRNPVDINLLEDYKVIDAKGKYICRGLLDMHTHLRDPGDKYKEDIVSGTKAAIAGGFTSIACMPNTLPVNDSVGITEYIRNKAKEKGFCRVYPIGAITDGLRGESLYHLGDKFCRRVVALSDDGKSVENDSIMEVAMRIASYYGIPIISHCEYSGLSGKGLINKGIVSKMMGIRGIPRESEIKMIKRDIKLAKKTGCRLHIAHVSTKEGVKLIKRAKENNVNITAEVTPHHLCFSDSKFEYDFDPLFKMNPPLRTGEDKKALIDGLEEGIIDVIASDHAPHSVEDKSVSLEKAPFGCIGLESTLPVVYHILHTNYGLNLSKLIEKMTINPSRILNVRYYGLKDSELADLIIIDPSVYKKAEPKYSKSKNCPFKDYNLKGWPSHVFRDGNLVYTIERGFSNGEGIQL